MTIQLIIFCGMPILFLLGYLFGKMGAENRLKSYKQYLQHEIWIVVTENPMNKIKEKLDKLLGDL